MATLSATSRGTARGADDGDTVISAVATGFRVVCDEAGVVTKARERFAVPITHVVTDLAAEREEVR